VLEIETTQPGVQFYSGNQLDGSVVGKGGRRYRRHAGFCLEPHRFPDSPNHPAFPSAVLDPDAVYEQTTVYRFGIATS
jgi:aldose 1-epimerase